MEPSMRHPSFFAVLIVSLLSSLGYGQSNIAFRNSNAEQATQTSNAIGESSPNSVRAENLDGNIRVTLRQAEPYQFPPKNVERPTHELVLGLEQEQGLVVTGTEPVKGVSHEFDQVLFAQPLELPLPTQEKTADDLLGDILKPISEVTLETAPLREDNGDPIGTPDQLTPPDSDGDLDLLVNMNYYWAAPGFCHWPLYFEHINVERHGYMRWPRHLQPVTSAGHFFLNVPLLPYKLALRHPSECIYTLGHYRPGSYVPYRKHRIPLDLRATSAEAAVIAGLILLIP